MKTAISMPDDVFARVTRVAVDRGLSRSGLIAAAVTAYLDELDADGVTQQIDAALSTVDGDSSSDAVAAGRARLDAEDW